MPSPVSHTTAAPPVTGQHPVQAQKPKAEPPPKPKEDTVQLSSVAKAYGNVDHEGK